MLPTSIQIGDQLFPRKPATAFEKRRSQNNLKEQLRDRLYDKGVNAGKMPSVQRPFSEHMRPYTAKLTAKLSKRLAPEPPLPIAAMVPLGSYREFAPEALVCDQELFPPPPEQRGKSSHSAYREPLMREAPERPQTREEFPAPPSLKRSAVTATVLKSITGVTVTVRYNPQTVGSLGPSKVMRARKDAINTKRGSRHTVLKKDHTSRAAQLEPVMSMEDIMRSQCLIARMSGKPEPGKEAPDKTAQDKKKSRVVHKRIWAEEDKNEPVEPAKNTVDAWIKKLQIESEKEDNQGAFVYLRQEDPSDPYTLVYCTYSNAEKAGGRFYTLSKKGFTSYFKGEATEFLSIVEWIMERELYEQIKSFKFFKLFRLWRAIKFWRHNVIFEKRRTVKETLERKMMLAKKGFARLLIEHRTSCRRLENQRLFDISEPDEALTLKQFEAMQETHMKKMSSTIMEVSGKTKEKFLFKINKTLDKLKKKIRESQQRNEEEKETLQQQTARNAGLDDMMAAQNAGTHQPESGKLMAIDAVYEHLGFQSNLSYAHRTDVRKECKMFIRFSYLLDFIAKTSLKNMYVNSMQVLDQYLSRHNDIKIPEELPILKTTPEFVAERNTKPIVLLQVTMKDKPVLDADIKFDMVDAYERPPVGKIDETNFDPTCHLQLLEEYQGVGGDIEPTRVLIGQKVKSGYVDSPVERWLKMTPEMPELAKLLKHCVFRMLDVVKNYERHSKNEVLHPYASVLEEWDEKVADKWEVLEDKRLSCEDMLEDQAEYLEREAIIDKHMQKMEENVTKYLTLFSMSLLRCWRYSRIPWNLVTDDRLREPVDVLTLFVKQIKKHKEDFSLRVPSRADIGFCKLSMQKAREKMIGAPSQALKKLDSIMVPRCE